MRALAWIVLAAALALPAALLFRKGLSGPPAAEALGELPDYGAVPEFSLTERSGRSLRRSELDGRPWLASFIFTRCPGVCPTISANVSKLHERLPDGVRLVSFSVDPTYDTPAVLSAYADRFGASRERWLLVTGPTDELRRLVSDGFHLSVAEDTGGALTHSDRVALVDREGRIRRYYRGTEAGWVDEALRDLERLG